MSVPWDSINISGVDYDLTHLKPFIVEVTPKAPESPTYRVLVSFGLHTFTKEWVYGDPQDHMVDDGREIRCFCPTRHGHSAHLRPAVEWGVGGRVQFSQYGNFLLAHSLPGINGPYAIFFTMQRAKKKSDFHAVMFVQSAYVKPELPLDLPSITFAMLLGKVLRGEEPVPPKRK